MAKKNLFYLDNDAFFVEWQKKRKPLLSYFFGFKNGFGLTWIIIIVVSSFIKYHNYYSNKIYLIDKSTSVVKYIICDSAYAYVGIAFGIGLIYKLHEDRYKLILKDKQNNDK